MIRSTQRKLLRLVVQTKRKYKKKTQTSKNEKDEEREKECHGSSGEETVECSSSNTDCDQDSDVSFKNDTDEEIDTWIECMKRSTAIASHIGTTSFTTTDLTTLCALVGHMMTL